LTRPIGIDTLNEEAVLHWNNLNLSYVHNYWFFDLPAFLSAIATACFCKDLPLFGGLVPMCPFSRPEWINSLMLKLTVLSLLPDLSGIIWFGLLSYLFLFRFGSLWLWSLLRRGRVIERISGLPSYRRNKILNVKRGVGHLLQYSSNVSEDHRCGQEGKADTHQSVPVRFEPRRHHEADETENEKNQS
jgi:hypothetical protein